MSSPSSITDNEDRSRLELRVDGELAGWLDYRPAAASTIIAHTEVMNGYEGQGLGGLLVRRALEAGEEGLTLRLPAAGLPMLTYLRRDLSAGWRGYG